MPIRRARRALPALGPEGPWGWMEVFGVRIGCGESLVAGAGHRVLGLGFGPAPPAGPEGPWPQGRRPWGWVLVFHLRIEVVKSLWWLMQDVGLGFGPAPRAGPEGPWPRAEGPGAGY